MAERPTTQMWLARGVYVALSMALILVALLPLNTAPVSWPGPDLLLALTLAWTVRRPDYVPIALVAAVMLLADLLFQRPPGLWAGLVVITAEVLRARSKGIRNIPFPLEWVSVAGGIIAIALAYRFVQAVTVIPQVPLGATLVQMLMTILFYPLVVLFSHLIFGVSRPAPGAVDSLGHRL